MAVIELRQCLLFLGRNQPQLLQETGSEERNRGSRIPGSGTCDQESQWYFSYWEQSRPAVGEGAVLRDWLQDEARRVLLHGKAGTALSSLCNFTKTFSSGK